MAMVKGTTEHFYYYLTKDGKGYPYYQIFEKTNENVPIALFDGLDLLKLRDDFPVPETDYIYFDEIASIIQEIASMKQEGMF